MSSRNSISSFNSLFSPPSSVHSIDDDRLDLDSDIYSLGFQIRTPDSSVPTTPLSSGRITPISPQPGTPPIQADDDDFAIDALFQSPVPAPQLRPGNLVETPGLSMNSEQTEGLWNWSEDEILRIPAAILDEAPSDFSSSDPIAGQASSPDSYVEIPREETPLSFSSNDWVRWERDNSPAFPRHSQASNQTPSPVAEQLRRSAHRASPAEDLLRRNGIIPSPTQAPPTPAGSPPRSSPIPFSSVLYGLPEEEEKHPR